MFPIADYPELKSEFENRAKELGLSNPQLSSETISRQERYELKDGTSHVASSWLSYFPGCCGIGVLHDAQGDDVFVRLMFELRERIGIEQDWGVLQYTDVIGAQPKFLRQLGYRVISRGFYNPNSGNRVSIWAKRISQPRSRRG